MPVQTRARRQFHNDRSTERLVCCIPQSAKVAVLQQLEGRDIARIRTLDKAWLDADKAYVEQDKIDRLKKLRRDAEARVAVDDVYHFWGKYRSLLRNPSLVIVRKNDEQHYTEHDKLDVNKVYIGGIRRIRLIAFDDRGVSYRAFDWP